MKTPLRAALAAITLTATVCSSLLVTPTAVADNNTENKTVIAAIGDWPYSQFLLDNAHLLINSINTDTTVNLVVHVGDLHSGSMPCTSAGILPPIATSNPGWNQAVFNRFQQFDAPLVYTPGDNEWADCHKSKQKSSGAPLRELDSVRSLFFAKPGVSLGRQEKRVFSQADYFDPAFPADSKFVENVMWQQGKTVFVTLNIPGGSNDDATAWTGDFADANQIAERADRAPANLRWLKAAFAYARRNGAKALVVAEQADLWDAEFASSGGLSNYTPFVQELAAQALAFRRPVLVINGDTHLFLADRPLADPASITGGYHHTPAVPNLQRVVVQGSTNDPSQWLRITIDTSTREVFSWSNVPYCSNPSTAVCR